MSFIFRIDHARNEHGTLILRGELLAGYISAHHKIRIPTTLGIDVVEQINFLICDELSCGSCRQMKKTIELYLLSCYKAEIIKPGNAEFTAIRQNVAVDQWIQRYVAEHGANAVYG